MSEHLKPNDSICPGSYCVDTLNNFIALIDRGIEASDDEILAGIKAVEDRCCSDHFITAVNHLFNKNFRLFADNVRLRFTEGRYCTEFMLMAEAEDPECSPETFVTIFDFFGLKPIKKRNSEAINITAYHDAVYLYYYLMHLRPNEVSMVMEMPSRQ